MISSAASRSIAAIAFAALLAGGDGAWAQDARTERVQFAKGTSSKTIEGQIKGYSAVDYLVSARAGQRLQVNLKTSNGSNYFNVVAPGAQAATFIGSSQGNTADIVLPSPGDWKVSVYLMRNAARRGETAKYSLTVSVR